MQRKASEFSTKRASKKKHYKLSIERLKKYRASQKFKIIFKTYRFDTEEGRQLYQQAENERSYTSPSHVASNKYYYYDESSRVKSDNLMMETLDQ